MVCAVILIHTAVGYAASSDIYSYYLPYFTENPEMWTGTGLRNSDKNRNANVSLLVYNQNGTVIKSEKIVLPPGGQDARVVATGASHKGWIQMISTRPLTGLCFFGKQGYKGLMADITLISNLEKALHIPHVGQNFQWDTTIMICNPNPDATTATLTFFDKDGNKLPSKNYDIPGNGSVDCALTDLVGKTEYVNGSVEISAEQGLAAFALYTDIKWENGKSYAGISAIKKPVVLVPQQIYYDYYLPYFIQGSANWTGVAFRNSNPSRAANVSVTVYGQNGNAQELDKIILPADGQTAFVAKPSDSLLEGWLRVKSDHPLTGLCFFGTTGYDSHMADITFIPNLSKTLYVPHVGQNYQWDTTIMICNPNLVSVNLSLRFVDKDGNTLPAKTYTIPSNGSAAYPVADLVQEGEYVNGSVEIASDQGIAAFALYTDLKWREGKNFAGISAIDPGVIPDDPDKDGDGYVEDDCNNNNPAIHPNAKEICGDRVDQDCSGADLECGPSDIDDDGDGYTENQGDCDDRSVFIGPKAQEICGDNIDQDCDGYDIVCNPKDMDNDGDGYSENQGDCNDANASVYLDAKEICGDGIDQNCDGADIQCGPSDIDDDGDGYSEKQLDCDDTNPAIHPNAFDICNDGIDQDCSGADSECSLNTTDDDSDGYTENQGDCDDANSAIHPNAAEICGDGTDQDCSGSDLQCNIDEETDNDGDGYTENQGDCNDANPAIHPNAVDICGDGTDQDCSGADSECPNKGDDDGDGFTEDDGDCNDANPAIHPNAVEICGDGTDQDCSGADLECNPLDTDYDGDGYTENQGDCNDANPAIHPNAVDICGDGIDQDCSGADLDCSPDDRDNDRDGYTKQQGDCNDYNAHIHPDASEVCGDGVDQNCDGSDLDCDPAKRDDDKDGFTENQGDCNDADASVHPNAVEVCEDDIDQDCNGADLICFINPNDIDDDGDRYTENQGDCNDNKDSIHPNALEICGDGIDQDCNGSDCNPGAAMDNDGDYYTENTGDCNDNDRTVYPGADEICGDGIDQDCNGSDAVCIAEIVGGSDTELGYAARNAENERIIVTAAKNNGSIVVVNGGGYVSPSGKMYFYKLESNTLSKYGYLPKYVVVEGWVFGFSYNFITKKADILSKSPDGLINSYFDVPIDTARLAEINPNGFYSMTQVSAQGGMGNALTAVGDIIQILSCAIAEIAGNISSVQEGCSGTLISGSVPVGSFETVVCEGGVSECANIDLYDLYPLVTASQEKINVYLSDFKDNDGDGRTERDGDCNDYDRDIYPGATELCDDGIDNNCDGRTDESECRDLGIPVASFTAEPSSGKAPLVVNLDGTGSYCLKGSIISYSWSCSDGQSAARSTVVMAFNEPGTYTVRLTVTTQDGKTDTAEQKIVVESGK